MTSAARRLFILVEVFAFSAYVGWYVWRLASFIAHSDTPKTMGWRADNLWSATKRSTMVFLPCIVALCVVGIVLGAMQRPTHHLLIPNRFFGYMAFCLLQQVGLNSYLT